MTTSSKHSFPVHWTTWVVVVVLGLPGLGMFVTSPNLVTGIVLAAVGLVAAAHHLLFKSAPVWGKGLGLLLAPTLVGLVVMTGIFIASGLVVAFAAAMVMASGEVSLWTGLSRVLPVILSITLLLYFWNWVRQSKRAWGATCAGLMATLIGASFLCYLPMRNDSTSFTRILKKYAALVSPVKPHSPRKPASDSR